MRNLFACFVVLSVTTTVSAADVLADKAAVQQTVKRSIAWLEADMQTWRKEHNCAACHHGPLYLWSINVARRQGYVVNEPQLQELTRWLLTNDEARIFPKPSVPNQEATASANPAERMTTAMMGHRNLSQPTIYLTHALNVLPDAHPLKKIGWERVINHLASAQAGDGSFVGKNGWRPIFNTPQILTRFAVTGIRDATWSSITGPTTEMQQQLLKKAEAFLANQVTDETHQGLVLRLLAEKQRSRDETGTNPAAKASILIQRLSMLQRPDGGWSQTNDRESDAFATGQSLYALQHAGVPAADPAIREGIEYLVRTQHEDGTWSMKSRPNPETGNPAEFLNPITYAATAWATLGIASCVRQEMP